MSANTFRSRIEEIEEDIENQVITIEKMHYFIQFNLMNI
jgi:hypothetical protein